MKSITVFLENLRDGIDDVNFTKAKESGYKDRDIDHELNYGQKEIAELASAQKRNQNDLRSMQDVHDKKATTPVRVDSN